MSSTGIGQNPGFQLNRDEEETEIPPLTWSDGTVTSLYATPNAFDPVVGQTTTLHVTLSQSAFRLRVRVINSLDTVVKELSFQPAQSGESTFVWNGTDTQSQAVRYSIFRFDLVAYNNVMLPIGTGQTEVVTYRPKGGVSLQDADKYRNEDSEYIHSSDEWVAAGLLNPSDNVAIYYDNSPVSLDDSSSYGVFRSDPFTYSAGQHTVKIRVYPRMTQTYYDLDYTIYLNRIHCTNMRVLLNGDPVQHDFDYFVPEDDEVVQVNYSLDAAEDDVKFYVLRVIEDSEPVIVRTETIGSLAYGSHNYSWDGTNDDDLLCSPGKYCLMFLANPDLGATVFSPSGIFITKYIDIEEGS